MWVTFHRISNCRTFFSRNIISQSYSLGQIFQVAYDIFQNKWKCSYRKDKRTLLSSIGCPWSGYRSWCRPSSISPRKCTISSRTRERSAPCCFHSVSAILFWSPADPSGGIQTAKEMPIELSAKECVDIHSKWGNFGTFCTDCCDSKGGGVIRGNYASRGKGFECCSHLRSEPGKCTWKGAR